MKAIALYLPQFHPIPENDEWWGKGFTEWTNVTKAKPLFSGHKQPYLPTDLGFYDLRLHESYLSQARLAQDHDIDAFCIYHYWFGDGKRLLEQPFENLLKRKDASHEFMLCWANQTWKGIWHGAEERTLIHQRYDDILTDHIDYLLQVFKDPRYLKNDGRPVFMIYNPEAIPDARHVLATWRRKAIEAGFPGLYLLAEHKDPAWNFREQGYDAYVFVPTMSKRRHDRLARSIIEKINFKLLDSLELPTRIDYEKFCLDYLQHKPVDGRIECLIPGWDNTPRAGHKGLVLDNFSPEKFGMFAEMATKKSAENHAHYLFIKSWNEWAEGNVMEPSNFYRSELLERFRAAMRRQYRYIASDI